MSSATAKAVFKQLQDDFPKQDCNWVLNPDVSWSPLSSVPLSSIDFSNEKNWNAYEHEAKLRKFVQKIKSGDRKPVILGRFDGGKLKVLDGHHRTLAHQRLNMPVRAYVATIGAKSKDAAMTMHASQRKGNSGTPVKDRVLKFTADTAIASTVHHPLGRKSLWHIKGSQQLPAYIQNVAHALIRSGSAAGESDAIHKAVGIIEGWAQGRAAHGKKVSPDVQAAAAKAVAEWEAIRAKTKTHGLSSDEDAIELAHYKNETVPVAVQYHQIPAAMRRVKKRLEKQGVPNDGTSLKQTIQLFQGWAKSGKVPLVTEEASEENLKAYIKRARLAKKGLQGKYTRNLVHGKNKDEAGGDTGFSYKQYHLSSDHVDDYFTGKVFDL